MMMDELKDVLVSENKAYKVDGSGRIIIPAHLKAKFGIENGDMMDYYTMKIDDRWYLCAARHEEEEQ
jgi:bifunctional DNA-binding transcriptional regulator/antitoxin component of YhaV-PrlF toxin-antitoxin module